jgi:hypothetical protein
MKLRYVLSLATGILIGLVASVTLVHARPKTSVKNTVDRVENRRQGTKLSLVLPYAFSSESLGVTVGVGGALKGYGQEQLLLGATAFTSFDSAVAIFGGMWDYRPSFFNRIFFSAQGMLGHYPQQRAYSAVHFEPGVPRPGSNDSGMDQYAEDSGYDNWSEFKLEYVVPIGSARNDALQKYKIKGGELQSPPVGGKSWNPLEGGVSILMLRQYNRYRNFEFSEGQEEATEHPFQLALSYNNTDYPVNPLTGSSQYLAVTQDFGWLESPDSWTFLEFEASKYFSLGSSDWAKQRIIALNMWTGMSTSWQEQTNADGTITVIDRPPFYDGAVLGGFYRMRAYPMNRFNDRSVMYTTAEYRYTLKWNPLGDISWLNFLKCDWIQLVGFVEGGRVANDYGDLFDEWKMDGGVGFRTLLSGAVVRLDVGISDETTSAWVMIGHPF